MRSVGKIVRSTPHVIPCSKANGTRFENENHRHVGLRIMQGKDARNRYIHVHVNCISSCVSKHLLLNFRTGAAKTSPLSLTLRRDAERPAVRPGQHMATNQYTFEPAG